MFYPFVAFFYSSLQRFQAEEHLLIHRHKHEMTLKFSSIKTDAAFTGESCRPPRWEKGRKASGLFPGSVLDKNITSKTEVQSQGKLCVCVCVSLIMQYQSSLHVCTSYSNMIFFHDGMTLRLPLIWENLEHAGTSLGKRSIWKSIWVWVNVRISPFFHSRDTDCVELGDWSTVLETHK